MEDIQTSFQILRLSAVSRLPYLLRKVLRFTKQCSATDFDALVKYTFVPAIASDRAAAAGLLTPEEVAYDPSLC